MFINVGSTGISSSIGCGNVIGALPKSDLELSLPLINSTIPQVGIDTQHTFTRTTTATVIDFEGVIQTANIDEIRFPGARRVENLFRYSSNFSNSAWVKQSVTLVPNSAIAPDATLTAYKMTSIVGTSTGIYQIMSNYDLNVDHIFSIYAKADGKDAFKISWDGYGTTLFNLSTGEVSGPGGMESVGNGWYRCYTIASRTLSGQALTIRFLDTSGDGTSGFYLWNAQAEKVMGTQTEPSEYVSSGVLSYPYHGAGVDGVKYFLTDRSGNALSTDGVLIEPASTNLMKQSEDFSTWANTWSGGATITANAGTIGGISAYKITQIDGADGIYHSDILTAGTAYTWSFYIKNINAIRSKLTVYDSSNGIHNNLEFTWGTEGPETYAADSEFSDIRYTEISADEWRVSFKFTTAAGSSAHSTVIIPESSVVSTRSLLATGVQIEAGSLTSYIPAYASTVTRTADILSYDVEDALTQGQGSLYCEFEWNTYYTYSYIFSLDDGTSSNRVVLRFSPTNDLSVIVTKASTDTVSSSISGLGSTLHKVLITYTEDDVNLYVDGNLLVTDNLCDIPSGLTSLHIGCSHVNTFQLSGSVKNIKYFKEVLSESEAIRRTL